MLYLKDNLNSKIVHSKIVKLSENQLMIKMLHYNLSNAILSTQRFLMKLTTSNNISTTFISNHVI